MTGREPVTPASIAARLDELGWSPESYSRVPAATWDMALVVYANGIVLLSLVDGHEVARFAREADGVEVLRRVWLRDQGDEEGDPGSRP